MARRPTALLAPRAFTVSAVTFIQMLRGETSASGIFSWRACRRKSKIAFWRGSLYSAIMLPTLAFQKRDMKMSAAALRRAGKLPAVFYGRKTVSTPISISAAEFLKVWKMAGENAVVMLTSPDGEVETLIHEVDRHPVSGAFRHADFYAFEKGQKLKIKVPIEFVGVAPAVKDLGGVLVKVLHELEIEAEPRYLPHKIEADISSLKAFGNVLTAKELKLPASVMLVTSVDEVVASVYEPKEEVSPEAPPDLSAIEVVKKGKEEEASAAEASLGAPAAPASGGRPAAAGDSAKGKEGKEKGSERGKEKAGK